MKKYLRVKTECLKKMLNCFSSREEFYLFSADMWDMVNEMVFANQQGYRNIEDEEFVTLMMLKKLFVLTIFSRDNIEILHELIKVLEYEEVPAEGNNNYKLDDGFITGLDDGFITGRNDSESQ